MKTLHLLRHAKSDWSDPALADRDRPLNPRGKRARLVVADHIAGWKVDRVVCSPARRARATAKPVVKMLGCPVSYESAVYDAVPEHLFDTIRALSDRDESVMLVGHNPSLEELAAILCDQSFTFPTAGLATVNLSIKRWAEVTAGCGTLTAFFTPGRHCGGGGRGPE